MAVLGGSGGSKSNKSAVAAQAQEGAPEVKATKAEPPYGKRFKVTRITRKLVGEEWRETVVLEPMTGPTVGFGEGDVVLLSAAESKPEAE